jgi:hypothetical protein
VQRWDEKMSTALKLYLFDKVIDLKQGCANGLAVARRLFFSFNSTAEGTETSILNQFVASSSCEIE